MLDDYQRRYNLYDWVLGELSPLLLAKYPDATAIDIGANVGDTAAVLCRKRAIPVLCVEGHPRFLPYLQGNIQRLPPGIEIAACLVGRETGSVSLASFSAGGGTAMIDREAAGAPDAGEIPVVTLRQLLAAHPRFRNARLLKTDTDGSDFEILASAADVLRETRPVLFFEYDPILRADGVKAAAEAIAALVNAGYCRFLLYDNFGHFAGSIGEGWSDRFGELDRYLLSHLYFGRRLYYYDVCAFSEADADLCVDLESTHRLLIEAALREDGRDF